MFEEENKKENKMKVEEVYVMDKGADVEEEEEEEENEEGREAVSTGKV